MKNAAIALMILATCMTSCQNEKTSEVDQKRMELEAKRSELKEKQELVALEQEMKNVETEIKKTDSNKSAQPVAIQSSESGRIQGESVILRSGPGVQFDKLANFGNGETVTVITWDRNNENNQTWYQVRRTNNQVGWVFGGFLQRI